MEKQRYKVTAKVKGMKEYFVDWYFASSEEEARAMWKKEAVAYGMPINETELTIIQM
jgi:hypothetical protein